MKWVIAFALVVVSLFDFIILLYGFYCVNHIDKIIGIDKKQQKKSKKQDKKIEEKE